MTHPVILDTNVFVAAGFSRRCHSARIIECVRDGTLRLMWNEATWNETRHILSKIPRLKWEEFETLFQPENCFHQPVDLESVSIVPDPDDRKFAALAVATRSDLVTNDRHLLDYHTELDFTALTPGEFWRRRIRAQESAPELENE